jgi:hypothetical protein
MLRHLNTPANVGFFDSPEFRLRDALGALDQLFTAPPATRKGIRNDDDDDDNTKDDDDKQHGSAGGLDPFFIDTQLVYSEFLDALASVIYVKQQQTISSPQQQTEEPGSLPQKDNTQQQLPLYVLLDQFLQSAKNV